MRNCLLLSPYPFPNTVLPPHSILKPLSFHSAAPSPAKFSSISATLVARKPIRSNGSQGEAVLSSSANEEDGDEDDDSGLCPVECVREFYTEEEFSRILERAKETKSLVVVDFYRTSCGSCKYIEQGFAKLCRGSGDDDAAVVFLKHNVVDEYDEQSEVADRLRIKVVPLFHFYKDGVLLEAFPTRDKERIMAAIRKYSSA
ncbi:putative thioredoxin-like 4, chloroplastic [Iris pallida]|uniref:Thioredoxin-like 4, chloroplastic n=1 Tax=Iris pallida TaxID=29817 RepID=A0AAX6GGI7_IRIPA|nr:putative thioredoxin-like 4, chloroplastic [Iris pallida]